MGKSDSVFAASADFGLRRLDLDGEDDLSLSEFVSEIEFLILAAVIVEAVEAVLVLETVAFAAKNVPAVVVKTV